MRLKIQNVIIYAATIQFSKCPEIQYILIFENVQNSEHHCSSSPIVCPQSPSIVPVMVTVRELGVVALSMGVLALGSRWFQADMEAVFDYGQLFQF